jgi:hypothetical protein
VSRKANRKARRPSGLKIRNDEKGGKRMLTAALLFGASITAFVAVTTWSLFWPAGQGDEWSGRPIFSVNAAELS